MSVLDVLNKPWAITAEKHDTLCEVYERHMQGAKLDPSVQAAMENARTTSADDAGYTVENGVAVIPVDGVLAKKMNIFTAISGGMSTELLVSAVTDAIADPSAHSIMLAIDSPGGEVDGTQQIADAVAQSTKPTAAWVDGLACSAAMWIASQCDSIYAASDTTEVGSIGVRIKHTDRSKANEASGNVVTHITTGKYKSAANPDQPLSQDDRAYLQDAADYIYGLFVGAVADGRGMTAEQVDAVAGHAQVFFAQQAVDNGLIDGIASKDEVISKLVTAYQASLSQTGAPASRNPQTGARTMSAYRTFATQAEFDAEITAAVERGKASATVTTAAIEAARAESLTAGATAERERITAIEGLPLAANHVELVKTMKADGTTPADAQGKILVAEGAAQTKFGRERREEAAAIQPAPSSPPDGATEARQSAAAANTSTGADANVPKPAEIRAYVAKAKQDGRTITSFEAMTELEAAKK